MPRCRDVVEQTSEYLDGELTWRRRWSVRLHVMVCAACRRYVDQMRETVALLRALGEPHAKVRAAMPLGDLRDKARPGDRGRA